MASKNAVNNKTVPTKIEQGTQTNKERNKKYNKEKDAIVIALTLKNKYQSPRLYTPVLSPKMIRMIQIFGWDFQKTYNICKWEIAEIRKLVEFATDPEMSDWDEVATALNTGRTGYQCYAFLRTQVVSTESTGEAWTKKENDILAAIVKIFTENDHVEWDRVAAAMLRPKMQCYVKFLQILEDTRRGTFLVEEDAVILSFVKHFGKYFTELSGVLFGRCRLELLNRYIQLRKLQYEGSWTVLEDTGLLYVLSDWPRQHNQTFQDVAHSAASANMGSMRRRSVESVIARLSELQIWKESNTPEDLATGLSREVWDTIKPGDDLIADLSKSLISLKARMTVELKSFQQASTSNKLYDIACQN